MQIFGPAQVIRAWWFSVLVTIILSALGSLATAVPISVTVGAYKGKWSVNGQWYSGDHAGIELAAGVHLFRVGYYGSFSITVAAGGIPDDGYPQDVVTRDAGTKGITFKNTELVVNPCHSCGGVSRNCSNPDSSSYEGYRGDWSIHSVINPDGWIRRPPGRKITLVPSLNYEFSVGYYGRFIIALGKDGEVTSTRPGTYEFTSSGNVNTLHLCTKKFIVDPGKGRKSYKGSWHLPYVSKPLPVFGPDRIRVYWLVPGLDYSFSAGYDGRFRFNFSTDAEVYSKNTNAAVGEANDDSVAKQTLLLRRTRVRIRVRTYRGSWALPYVTPFRTGNEANLYLLPDLTYTFSAGYVGRFKFKLDWQGNIASVENTKAARGDGNKLKLKVVMVKFHVHPSVAWSLPYVLNKIEARSYHEEVLVRNLHYEFRYLRNGKHGSKRFFVTPLGQVRMEHFQWGWPQGSTPPAVVVLPIRPSTP